MIVGVPRPTRTHRVLATGRHGVAPAQARREARRRVCACAGRCGSRAPHWVARHASAPAHVRESLVTRLRCVASVIVLAPTIRGITKRSTGHARALVGWLAWRRGRSGSTFSPGERIACR